jgi:hypothetical protein
MQLVVRILFVDVGQRHKVAVGLEHHVNDVLGLQAAGGVGEVCAALRAPASKAMQHPAST